MDDETMQEVREILREMVKETDERHARSPHPMESTEAAVRRIRAQIERGEVEE